MTDTRHIRQTFNRAAGLEPAQYVAKHPGI